jgi:hypothetical protein
VSKESRRAARLARESRQAGVSRPAAGSDVPAAADGNPRPTTPVRSASGGAGSVAPRDRAGRRERPRLGPQQTFLERYRSALVTIVAVAVVALGVGYVFLGSTQQAYACTNAFNPSPTPPLTPGSSDRLGFFEEDMGNSHVVTLPQTYLWCPPASGNHYNGAGIGPIPAQVYKPTDRMGPSNWIHNLEHGGMVVLYRNDSPGATAAGLQAFRDFADALPPSAICKVVTGVVSPVVARFDEMPHPYAALVWDRVMYLDTWDPALVNQFYLTETERLDSEGVLIAPPEKVGCQGSPAPSVDPNASASPAASGSPAASVPASVAPSASSSVAPAASPQPSAAPS